MSAVVGAAMRASTETSKPPAICAATSRRPKRGCGRGCARALPGAPVFCRQHPIGPYVLDFYCAKARLAVEVDGISHDMGDRPQRDIRRDAWLRSEGVSILHIPANDVMRAIDDVVDVIVRTAIAKIEA